MQFIELNGYKVTTRQHLYVYSLIESLPDEIDLSRIKSIICPVLAKSIDDQNNLSKIIDKFLESIVGDLREMELLSSETIDSTDDEEPKPENEELEEVKDAAPNESIQDESGISKKENSEEKQRLRPKKVKSGNSSFIWNITIEDSPKKLFSEQFNNTFGQLNYRKYIEGNDFNVKKTIKKGSEKGLITEFYFKQDSQRASYLMLIQRDSFQNHESHFYDSLFNSLKQNDINIERFFFYSDPRICWNEKHRNGIKLYHLATHFSNFNLILVGNVERLINKKGRFKSWTEIFYNWETRLLIPSNSLDVWNGTERVLLNLFTLIPPVEDEIKRLAKYIVLNKFEKIKNWESFKTKRSHAILFKKTLKKTLEHYFEKDIIIWIAACSVYPALYWDLTLFLGSVLFQNKNLVNIENILSLTRVPWFRTGSMPHKTRSVLLNYLDDEMFYKVTSAIVNQMQKNPPESSSASYDDYSFQLILYQLFLNPNDKKLLNRLNELNQKSHIEKDMILFEHFLNKSNRVREFQIDDPIEQRSELSDKGEIRVGDTVKGVVNNIRNYGAFVSLGRLHGMVHISEITDDTISHPSEILYIGQEVDVKIIKINQEKGQITLSLKEQSNIDVDRVALEDLEVGQVVEGVVKNITDYGAFIDLGDTVGLLHQTDISWGREPIPKEVFKLYHKVKVAVIGVDKEKKRVSLGMKQIQPKPWETLSDDIYEGNVVIGEVKNILDYGAFLEVQPGLEGLVHISEISWSDEPVKAKKYFVKGEKYKVLVVTLNKEEEKLALSIKQLYPDPWDEIETNYPKGSIHPARVINFNSDSIIVELKHKIISTINISDLSWVRQFLDPSDYVNIGQYIDVRIGGVYAADKKIILHHKSTKEDEFLSVKTEFPKNSTHEGSILRIDGGWAVVKLADKLDVSAKLKQLIKEDGSYANVGEKLFFKIYSHSLRTGRILASHSLYLKDNLSKETATKRFNTENPTSRPIGELVDLFEMKEKLEVGDSKKEYKSELKYIVGITPEIETILLDSGIISIVDLSESTNDELDEILIEAGYDHKKFNTASWSIQAYLINSGDLERLKKIQKSLMK